MLARHRTPVFLIVLLGLLYPVLAGALTCEEILKKFSEDALMRGDTASWKQDAISELWIKWNKTGKLHMKCDEAFVRISLVRMRNSIYQKSRPDKHTSLTGDGVNPDSETNESVHEATEPRINTSRWHALRPDVERLAPPDVLAILDLRAEGFTYKEIAAKLDPGGRKKCNDACLRKRVSRFKERLQAAGLKSEFETFDDDVKRVVVGLLIQDAFSRLSRFLTQDERITIHQALGGSISLSEEDASIASYPKCKDSITPSAALRCQPAESGATNSASDIFPYTKAVIIIERLSLMNEPLIKDDVRLLMYSLNHALRRYMNSHVLDPRTNHMHGDQAVSIESSVSWESIFSRINSILSYFDFSEIPSVLKYMLWILLVTLRLSGATGHSAENQQFDTISEISSKSSAPRVKVKC